MSRLRVVEIVATVTRTVRDSLFVPVGRLVTECKVSVDVTRFHLCPLTFALIGSKCKHTFSTIVPCGCTKRHRLARSAVPSTLSDSNKYIHTIVVIIIIV